MPHAHSFNAFFLSLIIYFERGERVHMHECEPGKSRERERERERERIRSRLCTVGTEPNAGFELTNLRS